MSFIIFFFLLFEFLQICIWTVKLFKFVFIIMLRLGLAKNAKNHIKNVTVYWLTVLEEQKHA